MSSSPPPNPYFSGINFNPNFFSTISTYLTEALANTKYLRLIGGTLSGFLGINRSARVELDINGKAVINNNSLSAPSNGVFGSAGTKLILTEGSVSDTPYALGVGSGNLWYGSSSIGDHRFYTGTTERMRINSSGNVGIGIGVTGSPQTTLDIRGITNIELGTSSLPGIGTYGSGGGNRLILNPGSAMIYPYSIGINTDTLWNGVPATARYEWYIGNKRVIYLNDVGIQTPNAMTINGADNVSLQFQLTASLTTDEPAMKLSGPGGIQTYFGMGGTAVGNTLKRSNTYMISSGNIIFMTNNRTTEANLLIKTDGNVGIGTNDPQSLLHLHSSANNADVALRITDNTTGTAASRGIAISKTNQQDMFLQVYENARMYFFTNNLVRMNILANGNVGIGALNPDTVSNCLQVGDGGKLRIANDGTDYTLIGTKNGVDANNTRIVINGYQKTGNLGNISYVATTSTGSHTFWLNNSTSVADIDSTDFTVFNSITTIGANYYTDGEYISYSTKTNVSGTTKSGYFITNEFFFNSLINISVSHNSTYYTYWHGHYGTNNNPAVMYVSSISNYSMTFESFDEQTTLKSWIYCCPTVSFNTATQLRVKFYG